MLQIRIFLFGPPRIEQNSQPISLGARKGIALLVYLAVTRQAHSRDTLATLFWPESNQQEARASLRRMLYRFNQIFKTDAVLAERDLVQLNPRVDLWLDVAEFRQFIQTPPQGDRGAILDAAHFGQVEEAVALYADDFMAGFSLPDCADFDDWQFFQREELRQSLAAALEQLMYFYEEQGQYDQAVSFARRWLALDRMHEPVHRHLMRLYACAGQHSAAIRQFEECTRVLDEELGVEPDEETTSLFEAIRLRRFPEENKRRQKAAGLPGVRPDPAPQPSASPASVRYPLPGEPLPLIGRDVELTQLRNMLLNPHCRLITLVGLGGIGKTHLALEVAHRYLDSADFIDLFPDGVVFVALAERTDKANPAMTLVFALADALGLSLSGQAEPARQLFEFLRTKKMLIILDNLEHLLHDPDAQTYTLPVLNWVGEILGTAREIKLLVTSREPLQLQAEWRMDLGGLACPPLDLEYCEGEPLETYSAVELFIQFARQIQPTFELTPQNTPAIRRLCQLVSGSPLALKMAAAWVRIFACDRIVNDIEHDLDLLSTQVRNVPARQRSMRAVFDYTWRLLSPEEQQLLLITSVFRGGFTETAITEIAGAMPHLLAGLLDRGLLQVLSTAQGIRYTLHDLTRQYAADRLAAHPAYEQQIKTRHTTFYADFLAKLTDAVVGAEQPQALAAIEHDIDNIEQMWERALCAGDLDALCKASSPLWRYYWSRTPGQKGKQFATDAIDRLKQSDKMRKHPKYLTLLRFVYGMRGQFHYFLGDYELAYSDFQVAIDIARQSGQYAEEIDMSVCLCATARWQGRTDMAQAGLQKALAFYRETGNRSGEADVQHELAQLYFYTGEYAAAKVCAAESLSISRKLGRPDWIGWALDAMAWVSFCCGDYDDARNYYAEGLACFEQINHQLGMALAWGGLGMVIWASERDRWVEAHALLERSLAACRHMNNQFYICSRLGVLAQISNDTERYAEAERFAEEGLQIGRTLGSSLSTVKNLCCLAESLYYRGNLEGSRGYVHEAIRLAHAIGQMPALTLALGCYATLLVIESELACSKDANQMKKQIQALALLERVADHPACWAIYREKARRLFTELKLKWPAEIVEAVMSYNQTHPFDAQVSALLAEDVE